jgi:hypothetical protein
MIESVLKLVAAQREADRLSHAMHVLLRRITAEDTNKNKSKLLLLTVLLFSLCLRRVHVQDNTGI